MSESRFYCPLQKKDITHELCQDITYAAEGRISQAIIPEITNWELAKAICADCAHAYWNKTNFRKPTERGS
ncbi:MAG: hypothetical protein KBG64_00790 [Clostridia bacterium]|nr:hypothetical protein [Clostridia bacterium]